MLNNGANISVVAGGDINPARFVKVSTAADFRVLEANAGESVIGISQLASRAVPQGDNSTLAASAGESLGVFGQGQECYLTLGTTVTAGVLLASDNSGCGVVAADDDWVGGQALQSGVAGDLIRVIVDLHQLEG